MEDIPVVILCGGKGMRLREETETRPKPLVQVGDMPILWHIMNIYSHYGFKRFILCLGYKGEMIKDFFINLRYNSDFSLDFAKNKEEIHNSQIPDWKITFANTGAESSTGFRLKQIEKYIDTDNFFLTYGDGLADVDINKLYNFHKSHNKIATVTTVRPITRFGNISISNDNVITDFTKKTVAHEGWIDGGFFVLNRKVFNYIPNREDCELEAEPLKNLAKDNEFVAFKHEGFWQCMDTYREYQLLNEIWKSGNIPWNMKSKD